MKRLASSGIISAAAAGASADAPISRPPMKPVVSFAKPKRMSHSPASLAIPDHPSRHSSRSHSPDAYHNSLNEHERRPCPDRYSLPDLHHEPPADLAVEDPPPGVDRTGKVSFASDLGQFLPIELGTQAPPGLAAGLLRAHDRVDAQKRHPAQNKRGDARRQIHTSS